MQNVVLHCMNNGNAIKLLKERSPLIGARRFSEGRDLSQALKWHNAGPGSGQRGMGRATFLEGRIA